MNLASMTRIDHTDPIGGLGPRVTPAPTPAPQAVKRGDGFIVGPDGKLSTDFPPPAGMVPSTPPHTPSPSLSELVNATCSNTPAPAVVFYRWHEGRVEVFYEHGKEWTPLVEPIGERA